MKKNVDEYVEYSITKWRENYQHIPLEIVEGTWQTKLSSLGVFDAIYFD